VPRLTNDRYYKEHELLQRLWNSTHALYSILTPTEQWELHDFYLPSEDLTKQQLIVHRRDITKRRPSLPHRAGKHRKKLFTVYLLADKNSYGNQAQFNDIIRAFRSWALSTSGWDGLSGAWTQRPTSDGRQQELRRRQAHPNLAPTAHVAPAFGSQFPA
jgi:hypothetical protein